MQNHRPARSRRKRVHITLDGAIHINPTHNGPADGGAIMMKVRRIGGSAIHAALMTALTRLLTRFLLAATLLLLAGLLPAATLLLIEQCGAKFAMISMPISAKISPRTENRSHSLVSTLVINERGTAGP
jgi:hypothetical protein